MLQSFDFQPRTRVVFGEGAVDRLGDFVRELGFRRPLLVADPGLIMTGHAGHVLSLLQKARISLISFHDFGVNPDTDAIERGRASAACESPDSIIALGGGSSLDCAKGINFVLTNGGRLHDYRGYGKAAQPMLPMIGIPTTTGTGSEAQSYAVVADAETKLKMACGDPKAAFKLALLDPALAVSQPRDVLASAGFDAIAHAVETWVTTRRNPMSDLFSREAWRLLTENCEACFAHPAHVARIAEMQLAAYFAGAAIENSMIGAAHACTNPLTARYATIHGVGLAVLLPHVVRWNAAAAGERYEKLAQFAGLKSVETLAQYLEKLRAVAKLPARLRDLGARREDLTALAELAAQQWTGAFNPRPFDAKGALEIYECAF